jgi:hypothetical protein
VQLLDKVAGQKPQLTALELTLLSISVAAAASGPWLLGGKLTEFLAPTAAACKLFLIGAWTKKTLQIPFHCFSHISLRYH